MKSNSTVLYKIYAEDSRLLYVGITNNLIPRLADHSQIWWMSHERINRIEFVNFDNRSDAREKEKELILNLKPVYNRQDTGLSRPVMLARQKAVIETRRKAMRNIKL